MSNGSGNGNGKRIALSAIAAMIGAGTLTGRTNADGTFKESDLGSDDKLLGYNPDFIIIDEAGEVTEGIYKTLQESKSVSVPETRQQRRARERREAKQKAKQLKKYRKGT